MKNLLILIPMALILGACAKGGGGGGGGGGNPTPTPPALTVKLEASTRNIHFGIRPPGQSVSKNVVITNKGTLNSNALSFGDLGDPRFSYSSNTCQGQVLAPNQSCSFNINFTEFVEASYRRGFNVTGGNGPLVFDVAAVVSDIPAVLSSSILLPMIQVGEMNPDGYWVNGILGFDLGLNLVVPESVARTVDTFVLDPDDHYPGTQGLGQNLLFLTTVDDGVGGRRDLEFSSPGDRDLFVPQWDSGSISLKEILPSFIPTIDYILNVGGMAPSGLSVYMDDFLDNRRMTSTTADVAAQYAYIWDTNRWVAKHSLSYVRSNYDELVESAYKDTYFLLRTLLRENKTAEFNRLSEVVYKNFIFNVDDMRTEFGIDLKYSTTEFSHSTFTTPRFYKPLVSGSMDMTLSDHYGTCRQLSYGILILSLIYNNSTSLQEYDLLDLYNTNINFYWSILRTEYVSYLADMDEFEQTRCLALMTSAALAIPNRNQVLNTEVNAISMKFLNMLVDDDIITLNEGYPLHGAESLNALVDGFLHSP